MLPPGRFTLYSVSEDQEMLDHVQHIKKLSAEAESRASEMVSSMKTLVVKLEKRKPNPEKHIRNDSGKSGSMLSTTGESAPDGREKYPVESVEDPAILSGETVETTENSPSLVTVRVAANND